VLALIVAALVAGCGAESESSDAEQIRDVVADFQRQIGEVKRGTPIGCALLTPTEHRRRDRLSDGPCERTIPRNLRSAHIDSVDVSDHEATVVLSDGCKIGLSEIPLPFSEKVPKPSRVWRISQLPETKRECPG
jgi:hypothetical protein